MNPAAPARMIRAQRHSLATPLIAFTPLSEKEMSLANENLSGELLTKPISARRLRELLVRHLSGQLAKA
jgi:hypothetical protein